MKQFQFEYKDADTFEEDLREFWSWCNENHSSRKIFQIFTEILASDTMNEVCDIIHTVFPNDLYMGCSTSGNIVNCQLSARITVVCTIFEYASTKVELYQYDLAENAVDDITGKILAEAAQRPWLKAIEMFFTIPEGSTTRFCDGLKAIRPDVQIFGGVSCSDDITSNACCVFSSVGSFSSNAILIVFYGGEDFHVSSINVTGWKPLGRKFHVTKSEGSILYELDGIPAYDVYRKYLNINNDENFFYNTLEFPLFYEHNDTTILRAAVASNADGSLTMTSDIDVGSIVRISYGDPRTIVESIRQDSRVIRDFQPDLLHIFSCAARLTFWTSKEPTYEIQPFKDISQSAGFFSHGEFLRTSGNLNQHNVTLVIAAMREGPIDAAAVLPEQAEETKLSKVPLVSRLATFISMASLELESMNRQLEAANQKLKMAAIIDGMTGLFNRREIENQIDNSLKKVEAETFSIIMLDIDNFKQVNDTYGHQEGDAVIIALANILNNEQASYNQRVAAGRWGGEEFMMLLHDTNASTAALVADLIRQCFANTAFQIARTQTVSLGVTQARKDDTLDCLCSRVDDALYKAKKTGKNKVIVL